MSSYPYPIYADKHTRTKIWFYHCSDKKNRESRAPLNVTPGTILDNKQNVLFEPKYTVINKEPTEFVHRRQMLDSTVVNLYFLDGEWYCGTKNSWNIEPLKDLSQTDTYGSYLRESLSNYPNFSFDKLDKDKMYTILFTNTKCHLFAKSNAVYVHTPDDDLADVLDVLPESDEENCVLITKNNEIYPKQTTIHYDASRYLYSNRVRCKDAKHHIAVAKCIISALCHIKSDEYRAKIVEYYLENLNEAYLEILQNVVKVGNDFEANNTVLDQYCGEEIPIDLLCSMHDGNLYETKHIGFYINIYRKSIE